MMSSGELASLFFKDLKHYNSTNFKTLLSADLSKEDLTVHKAFSSVVTRYFIFADRHPDISPSEMKMLYFKLKIDMIARYFSQYPATDSSDLRPFQVELQNYVESVNKGGSANGQKSS